MKKLITIVLSLLLLSPLFAQSQPLTPEQKAYELAVLWKEITYNFANRDHCSEVDLDSLYQAYIPLVMRTRNNSSTILRCSGSRRVSITAIHTACYRRT